MKKFMFLLVGLLMIMGLAITGCVAPAQGEASNKISLPKLEMQDISVGPGIIWSQQNVGLWINAEGKVNAAPDIALLQMGVEVQQEALAEAQRQAAESMGRVMKVLKGKGIADKDIQTQEYNIYPVRRWIVVKDDKGEKGEKEVLVGYRVTNMVMVKIRQLDTAGSIIDAATEAAGNDVRVNSISFSIDDPTPYYKEAREKAVKYAMEKAKQIATISGIKLGKPLYISESTPYYQPIVRNYMKGEDMMAAAPAPTAISGGELEISVNIQIVYDIN